MRLTQRIFLLILVVISLSTFANLLLAQYHEEASHADSEKILVETIYHSLRDTLIQDVIDGNKLRVTNLLKKLQSHENPIEYIYITSGTAFNIFAHSFKNGFPRYLLADSETHLEKHLFLQEIALSQKVQTTQGLIYVYSEPLLPGLDTVLHIGINQTEIKTKLADNRQSLLVTSTVIALLALLIAYYWSKQITTPLARFTDQIQRFGQGEEINLKNIEKNIPEIRLLANAFEVAVDERQHALSALKEREQNLEITLNSIGDAVIATDAEGNITRMNPVASQLTGWALDEALGKSIKTIFRIVDATTRKEIINPVDKVIATGEIVYLSNHTTLLSKDAIERQIADSAAPIRNENGDILGMVLVFNDVTHLYQLRQSVAKSEKKYQTLAQMSPVGLFYADKKGACLYVNDKWCEISGLSMEEALGDGWISGLYEEDKALVFKQWGNAAEQKIPFKLEYRFQQGGGIRWVLGQALAEMTEDGEIIGYVGTITDITERKEAEDINVRLQQQLHHSQKMDALGKLTGGIAHDYNNMLGIVLGYTELLETMVKDKPEILRYVQAVRHAGERGARLTAKLLSFSRPNTSNAKMLNINTVLLEERNMLEKTLTARIKLELQLSDALWPVCLNSSDLEDAIINLSINALHAMGGSGQLKITTNNMHLNQADAKLIQVKAGDYVLVSFSDTGCGMDKDIKEKIFEPFFSTKGDGGTGLGLSQVYGFVESNNGAIKVYSELGQGSRFILYFPRHRDHVARDEPAKRNAQEVTIGNERILVVDDEPGLLDLTCEILNQKGYRTFSADNARQALAILEAEPIDLLLTDVIMPETSGYELAAIVAKKYPQIKIQMASGFNDDRHVNLVDKRLKLNLLYKPYSSQALFERIRELLDE